MAAEGVLGRRLSAWNQIRVGDPAIESSQDPAVRLRQYQQVTVGGLLRSPDPGGEMRDIVRVGEEGESRCPLQAQQQVPSLRDG